ncbi:hypothetical protein EYF80_001995 [Liparis tanakae]|uniref:Uncharacterized protein n=1 Tax=Liparis tanakae TaxID=230148 RepID=A0A4Z2JDC1_9TELE|nr:hypothetical protein EYF80_001995 [Liparis tanakae]
MESDRLVCLQEADMEISRNKVHCGKNWTFKQFCSCDDIWVSPPCFSRSRCLRSSGRWSSANTEIPGIVKPDSYKNIKRRTRPRTKSSGTTGSDKSPAIKSSKIFSLPNRMGTLLPVLETPHRAASGVSCSPGGSRLSCRIFTEAGWLCRGVPGRAALETQDRVQSREEVDSVFTSMTDAIRLAVPRMDASIDRCLTGEHYPGRSKTSSGCTTRPASGDLLAGAVPGRRRTSSLGSHDLSSTKASLSH